MKKTISRIIAGILSAVLILGCTITAVTFSSGKDKSKTIYAEVIEADGKSASYMLKTDAVYLKDALLSNGFASVKSDTDGCVLQSVGGTSVDETQKFDVYVNGTKTPKSVDKIKIAAGARYKFSVVSK